MSGAWELNRQWYDGKKARETQDATDLAAFRALAEQAHTHMSWQETGNIAQWRSPGALIMALAALAPSARTEERR